MSENNVHVQSQQLSPNDANKYLGVVSQPNGKQNAMTTHLRQVADSLSRTIASIHLPHYYAHIFHKCKVNPKLNYPLAATFMSNEQINRIQRRIHLEVITSKGYNRKWPIELRYGHHNYCGLGMQDYRVEQRLSVSHGAIKKKRTIRKKCSTQGCSNIVVQGGKCVSHGAITKKQVIRKKQICKVSKCTRIIYTHGLCWTCKKKEDDEFVILEKEDLKNI